MQVNLKKLDVRIQKLQEIRRIAADPELVSLLLEFINNDEERKEFEPAPTIQLKAPAPAADHIDLVNQVLNGIDSEARSWSPKRG